MTPYLKALKGSEQCQDDCTGENFYVTQPFRKSTGNSGLKHAIYPTFTSIWSFVTRQHYKNFFLFLAEECQRNTTYTCSFLGQTFIRSRKEPITTEIDFPISVPFKFNLLIYIDINLIPISMNIWIFENTMHTCA